MECSSPGPQEGADMKKGNWSCFFYSDGWDSISRSRGFANFSHTQNPIIEIYPGTLQRRDFPCLPKCFIAICKI